MTAGDPLEYLFSLEQFGIKFGLDNIRTILRAMGQPQDAYASVHIAGTNGKGSVTAMVDRVVTAAGVKTGRYTSPHLVSLTERFAVNGVPVAEADLRTVVADIRTVIETLQATGELDVHPTFFEVTTAAAFELFRRADVEMAVCEVGLGGRLDATNVLTPTVTAITTIAKDHERYLGNTIADIAAEKAGIVKPGIPVVVGALESDALAVVEAIARERGAPVVRAAEHVDMRVMSGADDSVEIDLETPRHAYGRLTIGLGGAHQAANALVAVRVLELLEQRGLPITKEAIAAGLKAVQWPGRLQQVRRPDGRSLLLDAAHNPAGAAALAAYLSGSRQTLPLVLAVMRDKDAAGIVRALAPVASTVIATRASNERSLEPEALATIVRKESPGVAVVTAGSAAEAIENAWHYSPSIVVAGSIFLLGDVISALKARDRLD